MLTTFAATVSLATPAQAAGTGIYVQVGLGTGGFSGKQLVTTEVEGSADVPVEGEGCCPNTGVAFDLRLANRPNENIGLRVHDGKEKLNDPMPVKGR